MTELEQLKSENDRLRAELDAIKARVPSDEEIKDSFHWMPLQTSGAIWMRDRIFPPENQD